MESLGYTEYTGFALQYPRSAAPEFFADHIGNLTVELVLASVEISTLLIRVPPTLETLAVLQEAEAFPGHEPEGKFQFVVIESYLYLNVLFVFQVYYPEVPMLSAVQASQGESNASKTEDKKAISDQSAQESSSAFQRPPSRLQRAVSMPVQSQVKMLVNVTICMANLDSDIYTGCSIWVFRVLYEAKRACTFFFLSQNLFLVL